MTGMYFFVHKLIIKFMSDLPLYLSKLFSNKLLKNIQIIIELMFKLFIFEIRNWVSHK